MGQSSRTRDGRSPGKEILLPSVANLLLLWPQQYYYCSLIIIIYSLFLLWTWFISVSITVISQMDMLCWCAVWGSLWALYFDSLHGNHFYWGLLKINKKWNFTANGKNYHELSLGTFERVIRLLCPIDRVKPPFVYFGYAPNMGERSFSGGKGSNAVLATGSSTSYPTNYSAMADWTLKQQYCFNITLSANSDLTFSLTELRFRNHTWALLTHCLHELNYFSYNMYIMCFRRFQELNSPLCCHV
jgi:hypothetical protein